MTRQFDASINSVPVQISCMLSANEYRDSEQNV